MKALYASETSTRTATTEILNRAAVVADVKKPQYLIDVLAVPWNEPAQVFWRGEFWSEVFRRGAFADVRERAGRIRVNREHTKGQTVGKIVDLDRDEAGLTADQDRGERGRREAHVAGRRRHDLGLDRLPRQQAATSSLNKRERTREVRRAFLDHLSFVEDPTWDQAQVLSVVVRTAWRWWMVRCRRLRRWTPSCRTTLSAGPRRTPITERSG